MACLKCGRETGEKQVFCDGCIEIMSQYPVKPGTPIVLPKRTTPSPDKKGTPVKKQNPAQQIAQLQRLIRWLFVTGLVLLLLVCILIFLLLK